MLAAALPSPEPPAISRLRLRDVDEQAVSLAGWDQEYQQLSPGAYEGAVLSCTMKGMDFFVEESNQLMHQSGSPPAGRVVLALPLASEGTGWLGGRATDDHTMMALSGERPLDFRTPRTLSIAALAVALEDVVRYAGVFECEAAVAVALAQGAVLLPALVSQHLRDGLRSVVRSLSSDQTALGHGNAMAAFRSTLLSGFVNALGGMTNAQQSLPRSAAQHRRTVDRAVAYMREHAAEPITVVDLCEAAGVHSRVLQYCFNEVFGMTPMAYLRNLRLHQVRREIKQFPQQAQGDIAARWGIWHLGRFASDYRRLFGELPSATARDA
jgi:AraC family ethanolamine operon transcriptional activator